MSGAAKAAQLPGIEVAASAHELAFVPHDGDLGSALEGAEVLLGWDFRGHELEPHWRSASALKWVHRCGAGVETALFPALVESKVVLTNARGIFDRAMAEYVLAMILAKAKNVAENLDAQRRTEWRHRHSVRIAGTKALVFGVGSIGTEIGRLLKTSGIAVEGVGRSSRPGGKVFDTVHAADAAQAALAEADWVIAVMPATEQTKAYFDAARFSVMKRSAFFVNVGRGSAVDEAALATVLNDGRIDGAAIDVFHEEPLPAESPLWGARNILISPHACGDYVGFEADLVALFLDNLDRYVHGRKLKNVVDKRLGFVPSDDLDH